MTYTEPARITPRRTPRILGAGLLVASAALIGVLVSRPLPSSSSTAASPTVLRTERHGALGEADGVVRDSTTALRTDRPGALGEADGVVPHGTTALLIDRPGALGEADGVVPDGTTVFDDEMPGVAKLAPDLLGALRQAAADAEDVGVDFFVDSGWRSPEYQELLFRQAVSKHGSEEEAARWVATADTSAHVSGDAVDIGNFDATRWLSEHGANYGLCQIYSNEPWHYELRPGATDHGCPPMYADPAHDPRMEQ